MHVEMKHNTGSKTDHEQQSLNFSWAFYIYFYCTGETEQRQSQTRYDPICLPFRHAWNSDINEIYVLKENTISMLNSMSHDNKTYA